MFSTKKIKIDKELYRRVAAAASRAGYSSAEEFIAHVLEREVGTPEEKLEDKQVEQRLRGLGYIE